MLRLKALQMYNWGYAPYQEPLPVGDITLLRGNNGSGKTTYLTGIALLLGMRQPRHQSIDRYLHPGADWAFIRGLAHNEPDAGGNRPFDEILPATYEDTVTLACVLEVKGGRWQRSYYIVPGDFTPDPEGKVEKEFQYTQTDYRKMLSYVGVRDALLRLLEMGLFGVQDISRDPASRFQFFLNLVGDEDIQQQYDSARQAWIAQQQQTLHLVDELTRAEEKLKQLETQVQIAKQRRRHRASAERARAFLPHAEIRERRIQIGEAGRERDAANAEIDRLRREMASLESERAKWASEYEAFREGFEAWREARDRAEGAAREAGTTFAERQRDLGQQESYVEALRSLPDTSPEDARAALDVADHALYEARAKLEKLESRREELEAEIDRLAHDIPTFPPYVERFLEALREAEIPHLLAADAVEVTDPAWLAAVEGRLGGERFTVIVEDETDQIRAKRIGERLRYRHFVSPPNARTGAPEVADSLWEVVQVTDSRAAGWLYGRLSDVRRVESVDGGHALAAQGVTTITQEAYLQVRRGGRSVWPGDLVCGREARRVRLDAARSALAELLPQAESARVRRDEAEERFRAASEALQAALERAKLPDAETKLAALREEVENLRAEYERLDAAYRASKAREDDFMQRDGAWRTQKARLEMQERGLESELKAAAAERDAAESTIDKLEGDIRSFEPEAKPLDEEMAAMFAREPLSAETYKRHLREAQDALAELPAPESEDAEQVIEHLYEGQKERTDKLRVEVHEMREREQEYQRLYREARLDFKNYVENLFNRQIHRSFRDLCGHVQARGSVELKGDDRDNWHMNVRIGFHEKPAYPLEDAPLSQGQKVMTGLFLVLSALQAVGATPILLLDELMSTLDEINAPSVLDGLRSTGAQCLVATPHIRPQADAVADALWALQPLADGGDHAPPVGVLVRGNGHVDE